MAEAAGKKKPGFKAVLAALGKPRVAAMAALGPTLDMDLATTCPHCRARQSVRFAIDRYLLQCLAKERRFLLQETHRIARAYGWSHAAIMALPRRDRQDHVRLIDAERQGQSGRMAIA